MREVQAGDIVRVAPPEWESGPEFMADVYCVNGDLVDVYRGPLPSAEVVPVPRDWLEAPDWADGPRADVLAFASVLFATCVASDVARVVHAIDGLRRFTEGALHDEASP